MNKPLDPETNVLRTLLVDAAPEAVWKALTDPQLARLYMSATLTGEMKPGRPIQWFMKEEDGTQTLSAKGIVLAVQPRERLRSSIYRPAPQ